MKKIFTQFLTATAFLFSAAAFAQAPQPEVLHYKFDGSGTTVPNLASAPPAGTTTATIMGSITQGSGGQCGGALIGSGNSSSTDYLNTNWAPSLGTSSWTISFYSKDITASSTLFYIFGDANSNSFRCFTNGVAGPNNWILRGAGLTDTYINGGATVAPHVNTFVYDASVNAVRAYLDGVLVSTVSQSAPNVTGTGPFKVMGYATNVGSPAGGKLDEFRVYSRALSATEVASLNYIYTTSSISPITCSASYTAPSGATYSASGTYMDTIANSTGCDSIITINLTMLSPSSSTLTATSCGNYIAPSGATLSASGTYMDTIPNAAGCDSVITINLTVNQPSSSTINPTACVSYMSPAGNTYTSSGTYTDVIPNAAGCDSTITINLTVNQPSSSTINPVSCSSYSSPAGNTYTSSGTYTDIIPNAMGCDSTITINLTINQPSSSSVTATACDSYMAPSGTTLTSSGTYTDIIPNAVGCDSVITINLTVNYSSTATISPEACGSYTTPSGTTLTSSGTYTDIIPNMAGCDSVITINLTIDPLPNVTLNLSTAMVCVDDGNLTLIGGSPANGTYSGTAVAGGVFMPGTAGNGTFTITYTYTDQNSCSSSATDQIIVDPCTGITESSAAGLGTIYPNPNNGTFTLNFNSNAGQVTINVLDLQGRVMHSENLENVSAGTSKQVDLENLAAGVYFLQLVNGSETTVQKFVISK